MALCYSIYFFLIIHKKKNVLFAKEKKIQKESLPGDSTVYTQVLIIFLIVFCGLIIRNWKKRGWQHWQQGGLNKDFNDSLGRRVGLLVNS